MAREAVKVPPRPNPEQEIGQVKDVLGPGGGRPATGLSIKEELDELRAIVGELRTELNSRNEQYATLLALVEGHTHAGLETWIQKLRSDMQADFVNMTDAYNSHSHSALDSRIEGHTHPDHNAPPNASVAKGPISAGPE